MIRKYATMLSYDITDEEKDLAEKAIRYFDYCVKTLRAASEHLDLIFEAFKDVSDISPDDLFKRRAALRRYRDRMVENFNFFKRVAFKCYIIMQPFTSDTQTEKVLKSFVLGIEEIEKEVNKFIATFSNLKSKEFAKSISDGGEKIHIAIDELKEIIDNRIVSHVYNNILARNWVSDLSLELQEKVERKSPLMIQLVEERDARAKNFMQTNNKA